MSTESESREKEMGLDLDLHFLPAWAQQSAGANPYAKFTGAEEVDRGGRERRGRGGPGRGPGGPGGPRGDRRGPGGGERRGPRPPGDHRREGGRGDRREGGRFGGRGPGGGRGFRPSEQERPQIQLPNLEVNFLPEERGVESLARQIKLTGRAYPLFEIAYLILKKPERYHVELTAKKDAEGKPEQKLYICGLDDTLWLSEQEAINHVLDKHFGTFYSIEKIPTDPPKGTYTFVAQCGMSGTILGPPNYHDYQNKLRRLHAERFSRMPFDAFKSRIKIVKDEEVVKKWLEEQSFRMEFTCLNIPDTIKLNSREEVEKHFREVHLANVVKEVEAHTLPGTTAVNLQSRPLQALIRRTYDDQMRFPLKIVNNLSQQFARQGLQFFKVNKSITHVAVARPHYLDMEATPVSEGVKRIVDFINATPKCTRRKLIEALAPGASTSAVRATPPASPASEAPAPVAEAAAPAEASAAPAEGATESPAQPATASEGAAGPEAAVQPAEGQPPAPQASPEVAAITSDLHWLIHQGHVIEFANGILETAKKPLPRPPKPQPKKAEKTEGAPAGEDTAEEGEASSEAAPAEAAEGSEASAADSTAEVPSETGAEGAGEQAPQAESPTEPAAQDQEPAPAEGEAEKKQDQNPNLS